MSFNQKQRSMVLSLYGRIMRAHRFLPVQLRSLGDGYVRNEWKLHKTCTDDKLIEIFLSKWETYLGEAKRFQLFPLKVGLDMNSEEHAKLNPEQKKRLHDLKVEIESKSS